MKKTLFAFGLILFLGQTVFGSELDFPVEVQTRIWSSEDTQAVIWVNDGTDNFNGFGSGTELFDKARIGNIIEGRIPLNLFDRQVSY